MEGTGGLIRRSFFVNPKTIKRVKRALGVKTDAEAVRMSVERVAEMEAFWQLMTRSRKGLTPGSIERP